MFNSHIYFNYKQNIIYSYFKTPFFVNKILSFKHRILYPVKSHLNLRVQYGISKYTRSQSQKTNKKHSEKQYINNTKTANKPQKSKQVVPEIRTVRMIKKSTILLLKNQGSKDKSLSIKLKILQWGAVWRARWGGEGGPWTHPQGGGRGGAVGPLPHLQDQLQGCSSETPGLAHLLSVRKHLTSSF